MGPLERLRSAPPRGRGQIGRGYGAWSRRRLREGGWREARFPFVQIRHFARQRQWRRRRRLEPLIGFRGPVLEPISAGSEPGERGTVSMRSQYPAAQSRPQRPDWRVSLTTQERPRRPSSPGVEPRLPELGSQQPRLGVCGGLRGPSNIGMAPWSQAFWDLDTLRVPVADAPLVPDPRVPGGQVADRPTTGRGGFPKSFQPHPTACSCVPAFRAPARSTYPELCTVGTTDPERGQAETRGAASKTHPGAVGAPAAPLLSARHRGSGPAPLPPLSGSSFPPRSARGAGTPPCWIPTKCSSSFCSVCRCLKPCLITLCILNDWGHSSLSSYLSIPPPLIFLPWMLSGFVFL